MLTLRFVASVPDAGKGLRATRTARFFPSISVLWKDASFHDAPCLAFVTEVVFGQNTAVSRCINTLPFVFHFRLWA